jgi:hypothetical protein
MKQKNLLWIVLVLLLTATFAILVSPEVKGQTSLLERAKKAEKDAKEAMEAKNKKAKDQQDSLQNLYKTVSRDFAVKKEATKKLLEDTTFRDIASYKAEYQKEYNSSKSLLDGIISRYSAPEQVNSKSEFQAIKNDLIKKGDELFNEYEKQYESFSKKKKNVLDEEVILEANVGKFGNAGLKDKGLSKNYTELQNQLKLYEDYYQDLKNFKSGFDSLFKKIAVAKHEAFQLNVFLEGLKKQ